LTNHLAGVKQVMLVYGEAAAAVFVGQRQRKARQDVYGGVEHLLDVERDGVGETGQAAPAGQPHLAGEGPLEQDAPGGAGESGPALHVDLLAGTGGGLNPVRGRNIGGGVFEGQHVIDVIAADGAGALFQ